jgi:hypothetical protein
VAARPPAATVPAPASPNETESLASDRAIPAGTTGHSPAVSSIGTPGLPGSPVPDTGAESPRVEERIAQEPVASEPLRKPFEELVVSADSVIGLQAETTATTERARVEDRVEARVSRDVRVHDLIAIPAGARAIGSVTLVERGGRFKERARLGIRFHTLVLADGTRVPISTETIYRSGDAPGNETAARIGGPAVAGTIIGAIIAGGKGAAIGAAAGAGAGAATVMASDRNAAVLRSGEPMTVRLTAPITVTIEQK